MGINKCDLVTQDVKYLGHTIRPRGILADPQKVGALRNRPENSGNSKQVRKFPGLVGYYRQPSKNFTDMAKPLHDPLKEKSELARGRSRLEAVKYLKEALEKLVMAKVSDPALPIVFKAAAPKYAEGAVLEQGVIPSLSNFVTSLTENSLSR